MTEYDRTIAALASGSHGIVTRAQLVDAGVDDDAIAVRVRRGGLVMVHRGVFSAGHRPLTVEATYLAAVRACGDDALLRGMAAAHLLRLTFGTPPLPEVVARTERRVEGVITRRERRLGASDAWTHRGIPVTTVARTLVDLAETLPLDALARACHYAGTNHHTTPRQVKEVLARKPTAPGRGKLLDVILGDAKVTLSRLESKFLERLREASLPLPITNRAASARRVDCRWPAHHLTVELDSYRFHNSRYAWEQDRRREREAYARGDQHRRYTWGDVFETPGQMLAELAGLLSSGR